MGKSKITFPDGTIVEIDKDTPPQQIQAIITALTSSPSIGQNRFTPTEPQSGRIVEPKLSAREIWENGSQKDKLAIFVRNHFLPSDWFHTRQVRDQQLQFVKTFVFGESPAIGTYLNRLFDEGMLDKSKRGNRVHYRLRDEILEEYPELQLNEMTELLKSEL